MPNYRRTYIKGGTFFFTVNAYRRQSIFTRPVFRTALRHAVEELKIKYPFDIDAWVLLPDHMHSIWILPEDDANYSDRWSYIKRYVSRHCRDISHWHHCQKSSRNKRSESSIWQRRFWEHQIKDKKDYHAHIDYIYWNPVKHGYSSRVRDWPYSTFHRDVKRGLYLPDWGGMAQAGLDGGRFGE